MNHYPSAADSEQMRMAAFHALDRDAQIQAIKRLHLAGHTDRTIAAATGLSVEMVRRLLADPAS
jgi:hypothetical protein